MEDNVEEQSRWAGNPSHRSKGHLASGKTGETNAYNSNIFSCDPGRQNNNNNKNIINLPLLKSIDLLYILIPKNYFDKW